MKIEKDVQKSHFDNDTRNPRFKAYLIHKQYMVGDQYKLLDFMQWIGGKLAEFKKKNKISKFHPLSATQHEEFTNYLNKEGQQLELQWD